MKKFFYLWILVAFFTSCESKEVSVSEINVWSSSCSSFSKEKEGYKLSACCYYTIIPSLKLHKNESFLTKGTMFSNDGKGNFTETEVEINGDLSSDGKTLRVHLMYKGVIQNHEFTQEKSLILCDCACL